MNIAEVTKHDITELDDDMRRKLENATRGKKVCVVYFSEGQPMTYKWMCRAVQGILDTSHRTASEWFSMKSNLPFVAGSCLLDELELGDISVFSVYAILDEFSQHPAMFQGYGYRKFSDLLKAFGISVYMYNFMATMMDEYVGMFGNFCHIFNARKMMDITKGIRITFNGETMPVKLKNPIVKLVEDGVRFLMDCKHPPVEYMPEDDWYLTDSVNERKPSVIEDAPDPLDMLAEDAIENDSDHMGWTKALRAEARKEGEVVIEQRLDDTQKLIGIKVGQRIKYLVVASDFDAAHAPQIYSMLVRDELKIGKNFTTDRLSRMLEISQLTEAGFTTKEIASYFDISPSMVSQDKRESRRLEMAMNGNN